jgi:hypothetical protein
MPNTADQSRPQNPGEHRRSREAERHPRGGKAVPAKPVPAEARPTPVKNPST